MALLLVSVASSCPCTFKSGHNLFPAEDRFHVDIEQVCEGLVMFSVAPWENGLPETEYDDGAFFDESQMDL